MLGKCPICGSKREKYEYNKYFPFCSEKCKFVDLWNWFNEEYALECSTNKSGKEYSHKNEK